MTATASPPMSPRRSEFRARCRRGARWLLPAALLALTPKCVLCLLAYAGLSTALGLGGRELCGGSGTSAPLTSVTSVAWLALVAVLGALAFVARASRSVVKRIDCC